MGHVVLDLALGQIFSFVVEILQVGNLHAVGSGEGSWTMVTPVQATM